MKVGTLPRSVVGRAALVTTVATASALGLPVVVGVGATAAHASVICVGIGTDPLPSGAGTQNGCPSPTPASNQFDVNVCVAQPTDDPSSDGSGALNFTVGSTTAGASAWVNPLNTSPQGELEVFAAGTDTGIASDSVTNGSPC